MAGYKTTIVSGATTEVKKVVVGTPVRRVSSGAFNIDNTGGVDTTGAENGSLLIYNASALKWVASKDINEEQNIDGGSF